MLIKTLELYTNKLNTKQQLELEILDSLLKKEFQLSIAERLGCTVHKVEKVEKKYSEDIAIWVNNNSLGEV